MGENEKLRVAIYADQQSRVEFTRLENSAIVSELRRVFGSRLAIMPLNAADVRNGSAFADRPHVFILPGIFGEKSFYHDHIGEEGNKRIRNFVHRGGLFMGFCAGAYYAASEILYQSDWGVTRQRVDGNLSLFNACAVGPISGYCLPRNESRADVPEGLYCVDPIPVRINAGALKNQVIEVAYGLGPTFQIAADAQKDVDVLLRYETVENKPGALIHVRNIGRGAAILSGVLPQYGYETDPMPHYNRMTPSFATLATALYNYRSARRHVWDGMIMPLVAGHHGFSLVAA